MEPPIFKYAPGSAELRAAERALEKADALLEFIITANTDGAFDQYLHGFAEERWESIQKVAEAYDEARADMLNEEK